MDKQDNPSPQKPTLADQHWRADLRSKSPDDIQAEILKVIEEGNLWRFNLLLATDPDVSRLDDFFRAVISKGRLDMFHALETLKPDWNNRYNVHSFALQAAQEGHTGFVRYFVEQKDVDIHYYNEELLRVAAEKGRLSVVDYLLKAGAEPSAHNAGAYKEAAAGGHLEVFKRLLAAQDDFETEMAEMLSSAAGKGRVEIVRFLFDAKYVAVSDADSSLVSAAREGHDNVVAELLLRGVKADAGNNAAFIDAVYYGKLKCAETLLSAGADINAENGKALRRAAQYREMNVVTFLLDHGANPNLSESRETPLVRAAWQGDQALVKLLLDKGADHTVHRYEPLRQASLRRDRPMMRLLVAWDRKTVEDRKAVKMAEFKETFGDTYTVDDLRKKKGPSGESGLLIAARSGNFSGLLKKASGTLEPDDIYHPDEGLDTVLGLLLRTKTLRQFFDGDLWEGRTGKLAEAHKLLPPNLQNRIDLDMTLAEINHSALQRKMRAGGLRPPKL